MNTYPKADFHKTVDILVKAYLNGTLEHDNCYACAIGNMVAANMGLRFIGDKTIRRGIHWEGFPNYGSLGPDKMWTNVCYTNDEGEQFFRPHKYKGIPKKQIDSTGYSIEEVAMIEHAFETATGKDRMFAGLMAVVDVLAEIHGIDLTEKESAKALFVKA